MGFCLGTYVGEGFEVAGVGFVNRTFWDGVGGFEEGGGVWEQRETFGGNYGVGFYWLNICRVGGGGTELRVAVGYGIGGLEIRFVLGGEGVLQETAMCG